MSNLQLDSAANTVQSLLDERGFPNFKAKRERGAVVIFESDGGRLARFKPAPGGFTLQLRHWSDRKWEDTYMQGSITEMFNLLDQMGAISISAQIEEVFLHKPT